jgi:hypothetical protein
LVNCPVICLAPSFLVSAGLATSFLVSAGLAKGFLAPAGLLAFATNFLIS